MGEGLTGMSGADVYIEGSERFGIDVCSVVVQGVRFGFLDSRSRDYGIGGSA